MYFVKKIKWKKNIITWVLFIVLAMIWGSSFILMHKGLFTPDGQVMYTPAEIAAIRMSLTGIVFLPFLFKYYRYLFNKKVLFPILVVGFIGSAAPAFLFALSITGLHSSYVGMLNALTPIFTLLLAISFFKQKITKAQVIGVLIGFFGAVGLVLSNNSVDVSGNGIYVLLIMLANVFYAISINTLKSKLANIDSMAVTSISFILVMIPSVVYLLLFTNFQYKLQSEDYALEGLGYIAMLAILGTAISIYIFNFLIKRTSSVFASSTAYVIPIFAMFWGVLLNDEPVTIWHVISLLIIILGVYFTNAQKNSLKSKLK